MNSTQLIEYFKIRKESLGDKATDFNMFLEGYGAGIADLELRKRIEGEVIDKACEWLRKNIVMPNAEMNFTIFNFRKAMEE